MIALALACGRFASRDNTLRPRANEVLDTDPQPIANALHDVERGRYLPVLDLREIRDRDPCCITHLCQSPIESAPDLLQPRTDLIRLYFHCCQLSPLR